MNILVLISFLIILNLTNIYFFMQITCQIAFYSNMHCNKYELTQIYFIYYYSMFRHNYQILSLHITLAFVMEQQLLHLCLIPNSNSTTGTVCFYFLDVYLSVYYIILLYCSCTMLHLLKRNAHYVIDEMCKRRIFNKCNIIIYSQLSSPI